MQDVDRQIRKQVQEQMEELGLSNAELARKLGISPQAVGQIINGQRGTIPESLDNLLRALDLELVAKPRGGNHAKGKTKKD